MARGSPSKMVTWHLLHQMEKKRKEPICQPCFLTDPLPVVCQVKMSFTFPLKPSTTGSKSAYYGKVRSLPHFFLISLPAVNRPNSYLKWVPSLPPCTPKAASTWTSSLIPGKKSLLFPWRSRLTWLRLSWAAQHRTVCLVSQAFPTTHSTNAASYKQT